MICTKDTLALHFRLQIACGGANNRVMPSCMMQKLTATYYKGESLTGSTIEL